MKCSWSWSPVIVGALVLAGCQGSQPPPAVSAPAAPPAATNRTPALVPAGKPQARLPVIKLWLGAEEIVAEQAVTIPQLMTGMMFRTNMAENEGMLFIFQQAHQASFYMKNTLLPLDGAYVDASGTILEIHDMKPLDESPIPAASDKIQYVLEMNKDWFARHKIGAGAVIRSERGSLEETYFGRR